MKKIIFLLLVVMIFFSVQVNARDIYVAKNGNDSNQGTLASPYKTISKAARVAIAGDRVYIRAGTYEEILTPANSGTAGNPIIFESYQNEKVIITAMQALSGWTLDTGNIYKKTVNWDLGQQNFVLNGKTALDLARWPNNTDGNPFTPDTLRNTGGSGSDVEYNASLVYSPGIPNIQWENGGSVYFYGDKPGSGWIAWKAFVKSSTNNSVTFDLVKNPAWIRTFHAPGDLGDFFLEGAKDALDYQNEWYFDSSTKTLYVQLPGGVKPADGKVQMRRREIAINLNNKKHIEIRNLAVFGGSVKITGNASNNKLYGVSVFYGNYTRGIFSGFMSNNQSIELQGSNNIIDHCEIGYGSGSGIYDKGTNNKITNSYIHNFNMLGSYDAVLMARNGKNSIVSNNTLTRGGRDVIQAFNNGSVFSYNDVSYSNLIADDCALFYTVGGPHNIEIHHNWFHDAYSSGTKKKAAGIYLDNNAEAFKVHHNVVWNTEWTNIQINWNGKDIDIFNNTLLNGSSVMGAWHKEGTQFYNVKVWNNLSDRNEWEPQSDKQNNITYTTDPFVNKNNNNFNLKTNSYPIDKGRHITGITEGYKGSAPDVGAYEYNGTNWKAGINWDPKNGAAGYGLYGLPGEGESDNPITYQTIPGKIEAEDYSSQSGIQTENTLDTGGGKNVGYIQNGDYIEFDVDIIKIGDYKVDFRTASATSGGAIDILIDGKKIKTINITSTAGWQDWKTISTNINLDSGKKKLRLVFTGGAGYLFNINWINFEYQQNTPVDNISFNNLPASIKSSTSFNINVNYEASTQRDIYVELTDPVNKWLGYGKITVSEGTGIKTVTVTLSSAPPAGTGYNIICDIRPVGSDWQQRIKLEKKQIEITSNNNTGDIVCTYTVIDDWGSGFVGAVKITNNTNQPVNSWEVNWEYTDGSKVTSSWNCEIAGNNPYSAKNLSWNGTINPGQSVEFGFQGTNGGNQAQIPDVILK